MNDIFRTKNACGSIYYSGFCINFSDYWLCALAAALSNETKCRLHTSKNILPLLWTVRYAHTNTRTHNTYILFAATVHGNSIALIFFFLCILFVVVCARASRWCLLLLLPFVVANFIGCLECFLHIIYFFVSYSIWKENCYDSYRLDRPTCAHVFVCVLSACAFFWLTKAPLKLLLVERCGKNSHRKSKWTVWYRATHVCIYMIATHEQQQQTRNNQTWNTVSYSGAST